MHQPLMYVMEFLSPVQPWNLHLVVLLVIRLSFVCGEIIVVGNGQIQIVSQLPMSLDCNGTVSSDLDQNVVVSSGDFWCKGNGFDQLTGRGEVFVNTTVFNNCTRNDGKTSDDISLCFSPGKCIIMLCMVLSLQ